VRFTDLVGCVLAEGEGQNTGGTAGNGEDGVAGLA